ncbi:MAG: hypothetical protein ACKVWR_09845, partial [Acidimicrobiales bacterium]
MPDTAMLNGAATEAAPGGTSPFGAAIVTGAASTATTGGDAPAARGGPSPFATGVALASEAELWAEAHEALVSELDGEDFAEALEALAAEGAVRYSQALAAWGEQAASHDLAAGEVESWVAE